MRLILVGPPGAGKGTQAVHLAKYFKIPHISTGDIFRANLKNGTDLGKQAQTFMDRGELVPDSVTNEKIDNAEIIKRLSGRRTCKDCGAPSHVEFEKPKVAGVCDICQGALYQREDDKEEVLTRRLDIYSEQTMPIIKYYEKFGLLKNISALGDVTEITEKAITALK
jgi:adenylate kinase